MTKEAIAQKLRIARQESGLTQKDVSAKIGRPQQTIASWEVGRSQPDADTLYSLLLLYKVSPNTFFEYDVSSINVTSKELELIEVYRALDMKGRKFILSVLRHEKERCQDVPVTAAPSNTIEFSARSRPPWTIFDQTVSAGNGMYLGDESAKSYYLPESGADCVRYADFGIRVSGDSMEPRFHDGDILMVQKTETLEVGEIGVVIMDGEGYVKQIGPGQLISLNPRYAPIPMTDSICITGRVTGVLPYTLDELTPVSSDD